ncbi:MAG: ComEC/Rec2 family competence protein, partial [Bifidobacteriaceae bacterium]|nr:ComEC/Rec2 family competence protein [Bifidobacteriaceae bacterium]
MTSQTKQDADKLDLRLILPGLAAWLSAGVCLAAPTGTATWLGAGLLTLALLIAATAAHTRSRSASGTQWAGSVGLVVGAAGLVLTSLGVQGTLAQSAPLVDLAQQGETARIELAIDIPARRIAPSPFGGAERMVLEGVARQVVATASPGPSKGRIYQVQPGRPARTLAFATIDQTVPEHRDIGLGDTVILYGRLAPGDPADKAKVMLPGATIERIRASPGWQGAVSRLRRGLAASARTVPGDAGGLIPGVAIGDTSGVSQELDAAMKGSSLTHLTAVSGSHVAIVFGMVLALAAAMRLPRAWRVALGVIGLAGFVALVGPGPSVLRSALMGGVTLLALALGRGRAAIGALGASLLVMLCIDPWMSRDYGFALSVVATGALIIIAPRWQQVLARRMPRPLAAALAVPAAAQAACSPIIVLFSGKVSLVGVAANLAAAPAVPLATVSGLLTCLSIPLGEWAAVCPLRLAAVGAGWIANVAKWSIALPGAVIAWPTGMVGAITLTCAILASLALAIWL